MQWEVRHLLLLRLWVRYISLQETILFFYKYPFSMYIKHMSWLSRHGTEYEEYEEPVRRAAPPDSRFADVQAAQSRNRKRNEGSSGSARAKAVYRTIARTQCSQATSNLTPSQEEEIRSGRYRLPWHGPAWHGRGTLNCQKMRARLLGLIRQNGKQAPAACWAGCGLAAASKQTDFRKVALPCVGFFRFVGKPDADWSSPLPALLTAPRAWRRGPFGVHPSSLTDRVFQGCTVAQCTPLNIYMPEQ